MALLELRGIRKTYPGIVALAGIDLDVDAGDVHALLGENGAGKSTLMKVVAGAVAPDSGTMRLDGEAVPLGSPAAARANGIGIVFQELSLVPTLSVGENVLLGRWAHRRFGGVDVPGTEARSQPWLDRVGLAVPPTTRVDRLGMAERQLVEIAKALSSQVRVLLLDEPTSALSDRESRRLFALLKDLKAGGVAIIYVSHRLPEVLEVSDRITVLRDGMKVGSFLAAETDEAGLAHTMVGTMGFEERPASSHPHAAATAPPIVVRANGLGRQPRLKPATFEVRAGEVVTVFGLVGAGRTRLARTLFGLEPATEGSIEVFGKTVVLGSPSMAIAAGIGYVGEDRATGILPLMSVAANITLASAHRLGRGPLLDRRLQKLLGDEFIEALSIRTPSGDQVAGALSGGNQQKILLARSMCSGARFLILDDPVRGVDVGAKQEVFRLVEQLALDGVAVLYLTSELREARALGDRILVMAKGAIVSELPANASEDQIMALAGGVRV